MGARSRWGSHGGVTLVLCGIALLSAACGSASAVPHPGTTALGAPPSSSTPAAVAAESATPGSPSEPAQPLAPMTQYLVDLHPTDETPYAVQARAGSINGTLFPHNLSFLENQDSSGGGQSYAVYAVARHFRAFTAVAGIEDTSPSKTAFTVQVLADARVVFSRLMRKGEDAHIDVDLTGVYELKFVVTRAGAVPEFGEYTGDNRLGFGDAQLRAAQ